MSTILAKRIEDLTKIFKTQRQRTGGDRADKIAPIWARNGRIYKGDRR
ncbi:hypothetical protein [Halotia branconii]